jgi:hypothetical protein
LNLLSIARVDAINGKYIVNHNGDPASIIISFFATLGGPSANLEAGRIVGKSFDDVGKWHPAPVGEENGWPAPTIIATDSGVAAKKLQDATWALSSPAWAASAWTPGPHQQDEADYLFWGGDLNGRS